MPIQETLKRLDELEAKIVWGEHEGVLIKSRQGGKEFALALVNAYPSIRAEIARFQEENDLMRGIVKVSWAWKKPLSAKEMKFITDIQI